MKPLPIAAPSCPEQLAGLAPLASTIEAWDRLWGSDVIAVVDLQSDMETVLRWIELIDERQRVLRVFRKKRFVPGASGQPVISPLWQVVQGCETRLQALEDRIGLSPKARLQLGITFAEAGKSLDALNRLMEDDDVAEVPDPRLQAIDASAS